MWPLNLAVATLLLAAGAPLPSPNAPVPNAPTRPAYRGLLVAGMSTCLYLHVGVYNATTRVIGVDWDDGALAHYQHIAPGENLPITLPGRPGLRLRLRAGTMHLGAWTWVAPKDCPTATPTASTGLITAVPRADIPAPARVSGLLGAILIGAGIGALLFTFTILARRALRRHRA